MVQKNGIYQKHYGNVAWSASEVKKYYTYAKGRFGIL